MEVPRKNVKIIAGKPMIAWTIEAALGARCINRTFVSTEDEKIAEIARQAGAEVPFMRPVHLATDTATTLAVMQHFLQWCDDKAITPDYLALLQPTSPLRQSKDIDDAFALAEQRKASAVVGVSELMQPASHPWEAKRISADGTLASFLAGNMANVRRQELPRSYVINGAIYIYTIACLRAMKASIPPNPLPFIMPVERSVDVDSPFCFRLAEFLMPSSHE